MPPGGRAAHRRGMAPSCSSRPLQTEVSIVSSSSGEDDDEWDPTWMVEWWNGSEVSEPIGRGRGRGEATDKPLMRPVCASRALDLGDDDEEWAPQEPKF